MTTQQKYFRIKTGLQFPDGTYLDTASGAQGEIGYTGSQGVAGEQGVQGNQGNSGYTGSKGDSGYTGSVGPVAGSANQVVYKDSSNAAAGSANFTFDGSKMSVENLAITASSGDEGGELLLAKPATGSTISGTGVTIDVYQNKLRFFEQGGSARGAYLDITALGAGVATNLGSATTGYTGSAGTNGTNGTDGAVGFTGSQGNIGYTGSAAAGGGIGVAILNADYGGSVTFNTDGTAKTPTFDGNPVEVIDTAGIMSAAGNGGTNIAISAGTYLITVNVYAHVLTGGTRYPVDRFWIELYDDTNSTSVLRKEFGGAWDNSFVASTTNGRMPIFISMTGYKVIASTSNLRFRIQTVNGSNATAGLSLTRNSEQAVQFTFLKIG